MSPDQQPSIRRFIVNRPPEVSSPQSLSGRVGTAVPLSPARAVDADGVSIRRRGILPGNTFARREGRFRPVRPFAPRFAALPALAPVYSGAADPDSQLEILLTNSRGEIVGTRTVQVDAGGNWFVVFPGDALVVYSFPSGGFLTDEARAPQETQDGDVLGDMGVPGLFPDDDWSRTHTLLDAPHEVSIVQRRPIVDPTAAGMNLRTYFAPAFSSGLYNFGGPGIDGIEGRSGLDVERDGNAHPMRVGFITYSFEFLSQSWAPSGR